MQPSSPNLKILGLASVKKGKLETKPAGGPPAGQIGRSGLAMIFNYLSGQEHKLTFNPTRVPLRIYDMMRNSPTAAAALSVSKEPIMGVDWRIRCDDEQRAKFVEDVLRPLWPQFIRDVLMGFEFGYTPMEKVWEYNPAIKKYVYKALVAMDPTTTEINIDGVGDFAGITQYQNGERMPIEAEKIFLFTYKREYGNLYGRSRLRAAYAPWLYREYILQFAGTFYEKYGMPALVGYAPPGAGRFKGIDVDNVEYMQRLLDSFQAATSITIPWTKDKKWSVDKVESQRTGGDYIPMLEYLDEKIWEGVMVPELTMKTGKKGSYSLFEGQASLFAQSTDAAIAELKFHIDQFLIKPLVEYNFGVGGPRVEFAFYPLAARDKAVLGQIMQALIQNGYPQAPLKWLQNQFKAIGMEADLDELLDPNLIGNSAGGGPAAPASKLAPDPTLKKPKNAGPITASRLQLAMRKLFPWEQKVNFSKINDMFDTMAADLLGKLQTIVDEQRDAFVRQVDDILATSDNPTKAITDLELKYQQDYQDTLEEYIKQLFDAGKTDVEEENKLDDLTVPLKATQWLNAQAAILADKHQQDMEYDAQQAALSALSKDVSAREVASDVRAAFDDYADDELETSVGRVVQKSYAEGREWTAEQAGITYAVWSAVLDKNTCDFCAGQDGMTIRVDDPEFSEYSPGNVHDNCRCVWVYVDEPPAGAKDWETPTPAEQEQYFQ